MRVLIYTPTYPPVVDGTSIQAARLAAHLAAWHHIHVLTYAVNRDIRPARKDVTQEPFVEKISAEYSDASSRFPQLSGWTPAKRISEIRPDIVHIRGWYQLRAVESVLDAALKVSARVLWHGDGLHECHRRFSEVPAYRRLLHKAMMSGVTFVANSREDFVVYEEAGIGTSRIIVIAPFMPAAARPYPKDWSRPRILSLGRFFHYKGHADAVSLIRSVTDAEIWLAGAADSADAPSILTSLTGKGVRLFPDPTDEQVHDLYSQATHFVLASARETLGIVTLEAVAYGCIPLVRKTGGIKSYLPDAHLFCDTGDFRRKLRFLISQETMMAKVVERLGVVRERLEPAAIIGVLESYYRGQG